MAKTKCLHGRRPDRTGDKARSKYLSRRIAQFYFSRECCLVGVIVIEN